MELSDFLLARIAEDEAAARKASLGPWCVDSETYAEAIFDADGMGVVIGSRWGGEASVFDLTDDALHIARWDPARVLTECEAKRQIVEGFDCYTTTRDAGWIVADVFKLLALPYADHPDFRAEWRP